MDSFLRQVAADLYGRYGNGISSLGMVFPSRRAALFFGEALAGIISRPLWQPATVTVDELAAGLSGLAVGDRLRLIAELFKVYAEFHPAESFDGFYFWGELLLGDFDSIDKYLVDADTLFSNLVDLHALDDRFDYLEPEQRAAIERFWGTFSSSARGGLSPEQSDFLAVWRTLAPVYHRFRERLRHLGIAYQGMVYREAAERIAAGTAPPLPGTHYVVAGFNALSRSEQAIFDHLRREAKVDFYWDSDDYFTADRTQEAGMFMRDNLRRFPPAAPLSGSNDNFCRLKNIRSVATASDVLQCKWAGMRLADLARQTGSTTPSPDNTPNNTTISTPDGTSDSFPGGVAPGKETAIVLCDEGLLEPLLWSMPPEVDAINVTMGYPLRMHPAYTFVERLIELQNRRRGKGTSAAFYHSDVEGVLRHPYLTTPGASSGPLAGPSSTPPAQNNFVYIAASRLRTAPLFELIFTAPEGWRALSEWLIEVISEVGHRSPEQAQFFAIIVEHLRRLSGSLEQCDIELSTKTYAALLRRSLQGVTVPFEGEPLRGVQVMGILETRALDFENIIFLSASDANMPGSLVGAPSFIPYNLKAAYGLPTPEHHEGVYAYHFFRLISRARNIDLVWSHTADDRSPGTPSRYILQLDYESPHEVTHETVAVDVNLSPDEPIVIEKGAEVMARLEEFLCEGPAGRRLSPSLFFSYVECPLKFWFRGVARLRPEEEVTEEIDGALFGNILHHAMQLLYAPLVGVDDPRERIRALIGSPAVERAVTAAVAELYPGEEGAGPEDWGGNIVLAHKTIVDYINRSILPYDAALPQAFTIVGLEQRIEAPVSFGGAQTILFSGIADRIDRSADGTLRVVDYKTGSSKNNASALLQMGLYAMMLGEGAQPLLYYVRDMSKHDYSPPPVEQGTGFEKNLRATLSELFDPTIPFTRTPDPKPCEWCDYAVICRR